MASRWGNSWLSSWGVSWDRADVVVPPAPPAVDRGAGSAGRKRRQYEIDGKLYSLSVAELQDAIGTVLGREQVKDLPKRLQKPVRALQKAVQAAPEPAKPTYASAPAFDALWADFMRKEQHEAAEQARAVAMAMEIEADDADVFRLLRMIEEQDD